MRPRRSSPSPPTSASSASASRPSSDGIDTFLRRSRAPLCIGIGGGGDVVGALAVASYARTLGCEAPRVGGVTWERRVIDPIPGPRLLDEVAGVDRIHEAAALAGPDAVGPGGFAFAEGRMAGLLGEPVALVDPNPAPSVVADSIAAAAARLDCDAVVLVDVGGDALAHGGEPGLASPLCDAVLLAAGTHLDLPLAGAIFGIGCDGELTVAEVLARVSEIPAAGGWLGAWGIPPEALPLLDRAVEAVPTEASAQALRCARGETGPSEIRGGRRVVELSPVGAITIFFDVGVAVASAARLAAAIVDATGLEDANDRLHALGVRTELDLERDPPR